MNKAMQKKEEQREMVSGEARSMEPERTRGLVFLPATDIYEREKDIVVVMDVPGASPGEIDVRQEEGVLTVTAPASGDVPEGKELLHEEYATGVYERSFKLTHAVNSEAIKAKCMHGVLTLYLPKSEDVLPRRIPVEVEEGDRAEA